MMTLSNGINLYNHHSTPEYYGVILQTIIAWHLSSAAVCSISKSIEDCKKTKDSENDVSIPNMAKAFLKQFGTNLVRVAPFTSFTPQFLRPGVLQAYLRSTTLVRSVPQTKNSKLGS